MCVGVGVVERLSNQGLCSLSRLCCAHTSVLSVGRFENGS